jgi:hypothetical protein
MQSQVSTQTIKYLCELITSRPYRTGPDLIGFFNEFGWNDAYGQGFPSRFKYAEEKLFGLNQQRNIHLAIEKAVDPRNFSSSIEELEAIVTQLNLFLEYDGLMLVKTGLYYKIKRIAASGNSKSAVKNIIFASSGPKPDIVLKDALTNEIEIVKHAEHCLIFDGNTSDGVTWDNLVDWWMRLKKHLKTRRDAEEELYVTLRKAIPETSPPARLLFKTYYSKRKTVEHLPALLPEVYLHFDPKTLTVNATAKRF